MEINITVIYYKMVLQLLFIENKAIFEDNKFSMWGSDQL